MHQGFAQTGTRAVMTSGLGARLTHYGSVVKHRIQEAKSTVMAHVAFRCRRYMSLAFSYRSYAVVAITAHVAGLIMCKG